MPGRLDRRRDGVGWYGGRSDAGTVAMSVAGTEWPISDGELCLSDNVNN